ncbi:uncharacterized protein LOC143669889 [Tamandua tetradactyla]|uniref:uncharacterized protein LOC143669889 n=1 Tax=Tamandua tetradactyla TaxID=48850 RepID=UPI0040546500
MLPMPPRSSDPHDKPLAAPFSPNHPPCLSESLSLDCSRPSSCGRLCACAGLTPNKAGVRPYRPTEGKRETWPNSFDSVLPTFLPLGGSSAAPLEPYKEQQAVAFRYALE